MSAKGNRYHLHDYGVIRPKGEGRPARLAALAARLTLVVEENEPDHAAVETPFIGRNPRSTFVLAEARGVILSVLGSLNIGVDDYTPAEVKKSIVGHGRAEKSQIAFMVSRLLGLQRTPPLDAADAMAIALTHIHHRPMLGK